MSARACFITGYLTNFLRAPSDCKIPYIFPLAHAPFDENGNWVVLLTQRFSRRLNLFPESWQNNLGRVWIEIYPQTGTHDPSTDARKKFNRAAAQLLGDLFTSIIVADNQHTTPPMVNKRHLSLAPGFSRVFTMA